MRKKPGLMRRLMQGGLILLLAMAATLPAAVNGTWGAFGPGAIVSSGRINSLAISPDGATMYVGFTKRFAADAPSQVWQSPLAAASFTALDNSALDGSQPMWVRLICNSVGLPLCVLGTQGPVYHYDGAAFQQATLPAGETTHWFLGQGGAFVRPADGSVLFLARYSVLKSTDGGATFNSICDTQNYTGLPAPYPPTGTVVYEPTYLTNAPYYGTYGYNFLFYRAPWGELVIAGESAGYFHSLDDGLTWSNINPGFYQVQRDNAGVPWYLDRRFDLTMGGNVFGCGYNKEGELVLSQDPLNGDSIFRFHACGIATPMMNGLPPGITGFGSPAFTNRAGEIFFYTSYAPGTTPSGRPPNDIYAWDGTAWNVVTNALGQGPIYTNLLGTDGMDTYAASGPGVRKFTSSATALPPLVNLGATQTVTWPTAATLTASEDLPGPWSHEWTAREGWAVQFADPTAAATQVYFAAPGDYVINCQAFNGTVRGGNSLIVHVLPAAGATAPTFQTQPANATLVVGSPATFSVTPAPTSTGPLRYQWFQEGQPLAGATSQTLVTAPLTLHEDGATFGCMVLGPGGRVFSNSGTVGQPPALVEPPATQTVAAGQQVSFTVSALGSMPMQWEWTDNGVPIAGTAGHQSAYTIAAASAAEDGHQYAVTVKNLFGTAATGAATLHVAAGNTQVVHMNFPAVGSQADGSYAPGTRVAISAPVWHTGNGGYFTGWTSSGGGAIANPTQAATYVTLPAAVGATLTVTPNYTTLGTQVLAVVNGTSNGVFAAGDVVPLVAAPAPAGMAFDHWSGSVGLAIGDVHAAVTSATMPAADARAVALYKANSTPVELWAFY